MSNTAHRKLSLLGATAIVAALSSTGAWAQTVATPTATSAQPDCAAGTVGCPLKIAPAGTPAAPQTEEVEVTGSRVKRSNLEATSPVVTVGAAEIQAKGLTNTADVLNELPQTGAAAVTNTNTNFLGDVSGITTANLRNLGEQRTLVLLDGRRTVGSVPVGSGENAVDFSSIPSFLIDHVDVVTGGASSTYGSEAVAGVINVVLKKAYNGMMFNQQFGVSQHGDDKTTTTDALAGTTFGEGKGNLLFALEYQDQGAIYSKDRSFAALDIRGGVYTPSAYSLNGTFGTDAGRFVTLPNGTVAPYSTAYGFNRESLRYIQIPTTNLNTYTKLNYDITPDLSYFANFKFSRGTSYEQQEPIAIGGGGATAIGFSGNALVLPISNAYVPASLRALGIQDDGSGNFATFRKRFAELGNRGGTTDRYNFSITNGFRGTVLDRFDWEAYYTYGETSSSSVSANGGNVVNLQNSLNTTVAADGSIQCADPAAVAAGCAPLNLFGAGQASQAALNYIRFTKTQVDKISEGDVGADINGPVLHLPYGDVRLAAGFEHRREDGSSTPDPISSSGYALDTSGQATNGGYSVTDFYAEGIVPILKDLPFAKSLSIDAGYRHSRYSLDSVAGQESYKYGLSYAPVSDIRFRVENSVAIRAPTINDLYLGKTQSATSVVDPCSFAGLAAAGANLAARQAYCVGVGRPSGGFTEDPGLQQSELSYALGNPLLNAERARVLTYGVVLVPRYLPHSSFSVDGFKYFVANAIQMNSTQSSADECADTSQAVFCDLVHRNSAGIITGVDLASVNVGAIREQGIDVAASYVLPVKSVTHMMMPGVDEEAAIDFSFNYEYVQYLNILTSTPGVVNYYQGLLGIPKNRWTLDALYRDEKLQVNYQLRYAGSQKFDNGGIGPSFGPVTYSDLSFRYQVTPQFAPYVGITNLFDQKPKILDELYDQQGDGIEASGATGTNTVPQEYDPIGRFFYFGVKAVF